MCTYQNGPRFSRAKMRRKSLNLLGERAGARTQDPVIKSHVLYRLSYALPWPLMALRSIAIVVGHFEKHVLPPRLAWRRGENRLFPDHAFGPRCVGGWGVEVNSRGGCQDLWRERGLAHCFHRLGRSFQPDWRVSSTPNIEDSSLARGYHPRHEAARPVSSPRDGPRSAPAAACRRASAARPGAGRSARRCGSRCRARTGTS